MNKDFYDEPWKLFMDLVLGLFIAIFAGMNALNLTSWFHEFAYSTTGSAITASYLNYILIGAIYLLAIGLCFRVNRRYIGVGFGYVFAGVLWVMISLITRGI